MTLGWIALGGFLAVIFGPGLAAVTVSMRRNRARHHTTPLRSVCWATIDLVRSEADTEETTRPNPATPTNTRAMALPELWHYDRGAQR